MSTHGKHSSGTPYGNCASGTYGEFIKAGAFARGGVRRRDHVLARGDDEVDLDAVRLDEFNGTVDRRGEPCVVGHLDDRTVRHRGHVAPLQPAFGQRNAPTVCVRLGVKGDVDIDLDAPLTDVEFAVALDNGYVGVVTNSPATFSPSDEARPRFRNTTCVHIERSLETQQKLWAAYGKTLGGCAAPDTSAPACTALKADDGAGTAARRLLLLDKRVVDSAASTGISLVLGKPTKDPANPLFCDVVVHLSQRDRSNKLSYSSCDACYLGYDPYSLSDICYCPSCSGSPTSA